MLMCKGSLDFLVFLKVEVFQLQRIDILDDFGMFPIFSLASIFRRKNLFFERKDNNNNPSGWHRNVRVHYTKKTPIDIKVNQINQIIIKTKYLSHR